MKNKKKGKKFFNLPTYPGGKEALGKFIATHTRYPEEARKQNIQGIVHISFDVDHYGHISNEQIIHSVGYGCDEEAVRVVNLLKFNNTYNRGMRVKKTMKLRIPFSPKPQTTGFQYNYIEEKKTKPDDEKKEGSSGDYGYTIKFT